MKNQVILRTERLLLRPFEEKDAEAYQMLAGDRRIPNTTINIPHPYPDGAAEEWIKNQNDYYEKGWQAGWAITKKENETFIGSITLQFFHPEEKGQLGYWVGVPFQGNGYAQEAVAVIVRFGFIGMGFNRLQAEVLTRNPISAHILKKHGFELEGIQKESVKIWDKFEDVQLYGLLRKDWEKNEKLENTKK